jgi:hypothetical protein
MGLRGIDDTEAERLLSTAAHDGGDPAIYASETALFLRALRAEVPEQPPPALAAELVPRLAEAVRLASREGARTTTLPVRRPRRALVARVGIAVALIPATLAGLAFAGVTLPELFRSPLGIDLPNQPADDQGASGEPNGGEPATGEGKSNGAESSQGKSDAAHKKALENRKKAQGKAIGHTRGKAIGLQGLEPPGHTGDTGPPPHSNAGGSPKAKSDSAPGKVKRIERAPPGSRGQGSSE